MEALQAEHIQGRELAEIHLIRRLQTWVRLTWYRIPIMIPWDVPPLRWTPFSWTIASELYSEPGILFTSLFRQIRIAENFSSASTASREAQQFIFSMA